MTNLYIIIGDRYFTFDPLLVFMMTLGAMQLTGYDCPVTSWYTTSSKRASPEQNKNMQDAAPTSSRLVTSNPFEALDQQNDASLDKMEDTQSNEDGMENYPNDPLEDPQDQQDVTFPKSKRGRPKKGKKKAKALATKSYNTRNRVSLSDAMETATSASSAKFQVDDSKLANSEMMSYKSWADQCDDLLPTPPKHGENPIVLNDLYLLERLRPWK